MKNIVKWLMGTMIIVALVSCTALASDEEPKNEDPFSVIGNWFADRGKDMENATAATGEWISNTATAAGEGISDAANATGEWISNTATAAGQGISDAANATGEWISDTATAAGQGISDAANATGEWIGGRATDVQNAAIGVADWTVYAAQNFDPSVFADPEYYARSFEKAVLGEYSELDPTALSIGINIAASVANVDVGMDIRDLSYDIQHLQSGEIAPATLALDAVALVPFIGAVKYLKHVDTFADTVKVVGNAADAAADVGKTIDVVVDVADVVHDVDKAADIVDDVHDATKVVEVADDLHDAKKAAEAADVVHDTAKVADEVTDASKAADLVDDAVAVGKQIPKITVDELPDEMVKETYKIYEDCGWEAEKALEKMTDGTRAGAAWINKDHDLPDLDELGHKLIYREFDAYPKGFDPIYLKEGDRGSGRFVRDNLGNTYFTADHYENFQLISGVALG